VLGGSGIELLIDGRTPGLFDATRALLFSVVVICARGNVARLLRSE